MKHSCCGAVLENRDEFCCTLEIDGEWIIQQVLCFTDIVDKVSNHAHCLDERETKDDIHGNVGARCNKEGGVIAILSSVRKMDIKPNIEFCSDRHEVRCVHKTGENDGRVIIEEVDLLQNMRVLANHCFHEVKVNGA